LITLATTAVLLLSSTRTSSSRKPKSSPYVLLVDNGSLRADSFLSLTSVAARVSTAVHIPVYAASARFADRVTLPDGSKGESLESMARALLTKDAAATFIILPAFFGPSDTLTEFVPALFTKLALEYPALRYSVARAAIDVNDAADTRLAQALLDNALAAGKTAGFTLGTTTSLAVCDHGSPVFAVGAVRGHIAKQVAALASSTLSSPSLIFRAVAPCSMERRAGREYDFNNPLLENLLRAPPFDSGDIILSLLFISPGKHAGGGGDIDSIVESAISEARAEGRTLRVAKTALLGDTQAMISVLSDRLREAILLNNNNNNNKN
jgi:hypothetical protein